MTENSFPKTDSGMTDADKVGMSNCEIDVPMEKSSMAPKQIYSTTTKVIMCPSTVARDLRSGDSAKDFDISITN